MRLLKNFAVQLIKIRHLFIAGIFLFFLMLPVFTQQIILTAGGDATGSGGSASYSVGQVFYNTSTGTSGTVTSGVQQPFEIYVVLGGEDERITLKVSTYPNPTRDFLILEIDFAEEENLFCHVYNMNGALLETKKIAETITLIDMRNYSPALYFIKISTSEEVIKSFKVIRL